MGTQQEQAKNLKPWKVLCCYRNFKVIAENLDNAKLLALLLLSEQGKEHTYRGIYLASRK